MPVPKYYIHCYALFLLLLPFFRDCQDCILPILPHSSAEYIYQWQKKVNLERRSQVDRVWSCRADPPDPTFPISPLCSQTHCNWGQWKGEPSLPVPGHIWGDYFNNITNSDYLIPCGFWSTLSDRQAAKIPASAQKLWFYLSRQVHYSPHERCP